MQALTQKSTIVSNYTLKKISAFLLGVIICATFVPGLAWAENGQSEISREAQKEIYEKARSSRRVRIAILDFGGEEVDSWIKESLTDKFENQIVNLRRFQVISRRNIKEVEKELEFNITGMIDETQALQVGNMLAAQKLIAGKIRYYNEEQDEDSEVYKIKMTVNIRILGVEQGVVLTAFDITARSEDKDQETAISQTIDKVVSQFIAKIQKIYPLEAQIIKIENGEAFINMGQSFGIEKGMFFEVYRLTEEIADLHTDEILGQEEERIGLIEVQSVKPKFSGAKILKGRRKIDAGDKIKEVIGLVLPKWDLFLLYSVNPVDVKKNTEDVAQHQYHAGVACEIFDPVILEGQLGHLRMDSIGGFSADISVKLRITLISELLDGYICGGYSYNWISQDIPDADKIFSELGIDSDDDSVSNGVSGYSGSLELRLKTLNLVKIRGRLINIFQPFFEIRYQHRKPMKKWEVKYKTDKKDEEGKKDIAEYLSYPSVDINDVVFRLGIVLIGW